MDTVYSTEYETPWQKAYIITLYIRYQRGMGAEETGNKKHDISRKAYLICKIKVNTSVLATSIMIRHLRP